MLLVSLQIYQMTCMSGTAIGQARGSMAVLECRKDSACSQEGEKEMVVAKVSRRSVEIGSTSSTESLEAPGEFSVSASFEDSSMTSGWEASSRFSDTSGYMGEQEAGDVCANMSVPTLKNAGGPFSNQRMEMLAKFSVKSPGKSSANAFPAGCLLLAGPQESGESFTNLIIVKLADSTPEIRLKALRSVHVCVVKNMIRMEVLYETAEPLCRNLLEWFNLPNPSHQDTVLSILIKLAQDSYMKKWLVEIGALEFMKQFGAHNTETFLQHVTLLISLLSQMDVSKINQSFLMQSAVLPEDVLNPVGVVATFPQPCLHSIGPQQSILSHEGNSSCGAAESYEVGPTLPFIDLEPADIQYLFELNGLGPSSALHWIIVKLCGLVCCQMTSHLRLPERLHDVQHPQVVEEALLELRETVVVDFHPEAILQSQPIVENVLALIHALKNSTLVTLALDFLCSLIRRIKAALSLSYEAAFQVHPGAGSIDVPDNSNEQHRPNVGGAVVPSTPVISRSYPVSMQEDIKPVKRVPGTSVIKGRLVLHLGQSLHMIALQLIKLLTELEYHQAIFKVLHELILLLKPPEDKTLSSKLRTHYVQYFGALDDVVGSLGGDSDDLGDLCVRGIMQDEKHSDNSWPLRCIPLLTVLSYTADMLSLLKPAEAAGLLPFKLIKALRALTSDLILAECNFGIHTRILPYFEFLDPDYHSSYCFAHDVYGAFSAVERAVHAALDCINVGASPSKTLATTDFATLANYMSDAFPYLVDFEDVSLVRKFISVAINLLEIEVDNFQTQRDRSVGKLKRMKRNLGMRFDPEDLRAQTFWLVINADIEQKIAQMSNLIVDLISHSSGNIRRTAYEALLGVSSSERARTYEWCALNKMGSGDACEDHTGNCMEENSKDASIPLSPASTLHSILLGGSRVMGELLMIGIHDAATCKLAAELLLNHVEFLGVHDRIQMIPALSWIACSVSLTRECSTADKVANHLFDAMELKRSSVEGEITNYDTLMAAWTEISFFLRPLFCSSSSQRCKAAHELLGALQACSKNEGYVSWWITQSEICIRRKNPSHYMHDPFRYFLLFDVEEYLRGSQTVTFVNLVQDTEDQPGFEFPVSKNQNNQKLVDLLDLIKSSTPTCRIARKCAVEQLIEVPLKRLLQVTEGDLDFIDILVYEVVSWMKLGHQRSEGQLNSVTDDGTMPPGMVMGEGCLSLLTRLATSPSACEISRIRCWLISDPKQRVEPLLPLVFHPITSVRKNMALLLCFLLFSADLLYSDLRKVLSANDQLYPGSCIQIPYPSTEAVQLFVPVTFIYCYRFPCGAVPVDLRQPVSAAQTCRCNAFVHNMVAQLKLLDGWSCSVLQKLYKMKSSIASRVGVSPLELQAVRCICALSADYVIESLLEQLAYPKDYRDEIRQLAELAAQCSRHAEAAIILAQSNWMAPFERLLRTGPTLGDKFTLLLKILHVVELMMGTNCMTSSGLIFLSTSLRDTLLPFLVKRLSAECGHSLNSTVQDTSLLPNQVNLSILHLIFNLLLSAENHVDKELFGRVLTVLLEGSSLLSVLHTIIVQIQNAPYTISVLAIQSISLLAKGMAVDVECKASPNIFSFMKLKFSDKTKVVEPIQEKETTGSVEDDIVQLIVPLVKHITWFYHSDTPSLRFKQLVREIVYCLWSITSSISPFLWEELWASTGVTHWLSRLITDPEGTVRGMAFGILAMLASPVTPMTQRMLLKNWPEVGMVAVRSVLNIQECYAVRQESLRFILASNFWTAACRFNIEDVVGDATMQFDFEELDPFDINAALHKCKFWAALPLMLKEENATPGFYRVFLELIGRLALTNIEFVQNQFVLVPSIFEALLHHLGCPTSDHLELCEKGRESYVTVWERRRMHTRIQLADRYSVTAQIAKMLDLLACDGDLILKDQVSNPTMVAALICAFCNCGIDNEDVENLLLGYGTLRSPKQRTLEEQAKPVHKVITQYERAEAVFHVAATLNTILQDLYMQDRNHQLSPLQACARGCGASDISEHSFEDIVIPKAGCNQGRSDMNVDEILSTSGRIICTAAASVLTAFPSVHVLRRAINGNDDDIMQGSSGIDNYPLIWRMWLSVSALLATLLSEEKKAQLVLCEEYEACGAVTNEGGANHYSDQIVSALFVVLEDLYAESRKARTSRDFRFLDHLVLILSAVGRAFQNMVTFSPRAKLFAVQALVPRKLIKLAHDSYSILAYGYIRRCQNIVRRPKRGSWVICKAMMSSTRRPQWNPSWQGAKSFSSVQPTSPCKHLGGRRNFVGEPREMRNNSLSGVRQFRALIFEELLLSIRLLEHLVYKSAEAAKASVESGVFGLIESVWDFAHENEDLLSELLGLLTNLAAQCDQAKVVITEVGVMDRVVDFILLPNVGTVCYGVALSLLQTLMTRAEPRARFLHKQWLGGLITQLRNHISTKNVCRQHLLLQLLVNVSAFPHGQMMVTKHLSLDGQFDLVLDIVQQGKEPAASSALFLLRNLSFCPECQIHFWSNERTVPLLLLSLQTPSLDGRAYASSAIWELLFQGNRFMLVFKPLASTLLAAEIAAKADLINMESLASRPESQVVTMLRQLEQSLHAINKLLGENSVEPQDFPGEDDDVWTKEVL